jgi:exodeoxyribonuclease III
VRFATWNVNSLKARLPRVEDWLQYAQPDVLCLQETKLSDDAFPALELLGLGYTSAHHGAGRWNGVAILSRVGLDDPVSGFGDGADPDPEARMLGRAPGHEQYHYKLAWLERLHGHLQATVQPGDDVVVCGDINIAPTDLDLWDPAAFVDSTHVTPEEREALERLEQWGLRDVFREQYPGVDGLFSWWDYRAGSFHKKQGMRIDLVLATSSLADRARWALIDRNARKGSKPSDHAPVLVDFDLDRQPH